VVPGAEAEAGAQGAEGVVGAVESRVTRLVAEGAHLVEGGAHVAVEVALPVQCSQAVELGAALHSDPAPADQIGRHGLGELAGFDQGGVRIAEDMALGGGPVGDEQRQVRQ
jgi:hypothetical protein